MDWTSKKLEYEGKLKDIKGLSTEQKKTVGQILIDNMQWGAIKGSVIGGTIYFISRNFTMGFLGFSYLKAI